MDRPRKSSINRKTLCARTFVSRFGRIVANPEGNPITGGASMHNELPEKRGGNFPTRRAGLGNLLKTRLFRHLRYG
jgi:hypothetical protein